MTRGNNRLSEQINQSVQDFMASLPGDEHATVVHSFGKLHASSAAVDAVNNQDTPSDFSLPNATGETLTLEGNDQTELTFRDDPRTGVWKTGLTQPCYE